MIIAHSIQTQRLLPHMQYQKRSVLGLVGSGNETIAHVWSIQFWINESTTVSRTLSNQSETEHCML